MAAKVSADTIGNLTAEHAFGGQKVPPQPTAAELIADIRKNIQVRLQTLKEKAAESRIDLDADAPPTPFEIAHEKYIKRMAEFENMVANVPKGYRLTPVLYSKIGREHNQHVYEEFSREVRRAFMRHVATHNAKELQALGMCAHAIQQMRRGLDPVSENGVPYPVNIDHIVERSGGGRMSQERAHDPVSGLRVYKVNHFSNLILMPEHVHEAKNKLNDIQEAANSSPDAARWVLMMIPEVGNGHSGYVSQPQDPGHYLHGIFPKPRDLSSLIDKLSTMMAKLHQTLQDMRKKNPAVDAAFNLPEKGSLRSAFARAVSTDQEQQRALRSSIRPLVEDINTTLRKTFNIATAKSDVQDKDLKGFVPFYNSTAFKALRNNAEILPLDEADKLRKAIANVDRKLGKNTPRL